MVDIPFVTGDYRRTVADALKYVGGKADFAFTGTGCKLVEIRKADDMLYRNVIGTMNLAVKSQPTS